MFNICGWLGGAGLQKDEHGTQVEANGAKNYRKEERSRAECLRRALQVDAMSSAFDQDFGGP